MKKILFVFGTRPEAIKVAPVILNLKRERDLFRVKVCVTAQHRDLLDQVLDIFGIRTDYDLNIMQADQSLYYITTSVLTRIQKVLDKEKPDMVLVHGDTTTAFAGALASFYGKIPVGHIEAGLRTYDRFNPYPEEVNRLLTDSICEIHFAPTLNSREALLKENIKPDKIFVTGNTVIDAFFIALKRSRSFENPSLKKIFNPGSSIRNRRLILVTAHRRENFGKPIISICRALKKITGKYRDIEVIYPVHPNPNIDGPVRKILGEASRIHLVKPLNYLDLVNVMRRSYLVLTDSGGLQEEAPSLGIPVLVLRKVTERPEGVKAGTVKVAGLDEDKIVKEASLLIEDKRVYRKMSCAVNPYGDGRASARVVEALKYFFGLRNSRPSDFSPKY